MPDWKKLFANSQLTWQSDERHREQLDHFYARNPNDELFESLYPGYVASRAIADIPVIEAIEPETVSLDVVGTAVEAPEIVEPPKKKSKKPSPTI